MAQTLTFTFNNTEGVAISGTFVFTGGVNKSCTITQPAPYGVQTFTDMTSITLTIPTGVSNVEVSLVSGAGSITGILIPLSLHDNLTALSTGDSTTWGVGNGSGLPTLTTLAGLFTGGTLLTSVPANIPSTCKSSRTRFTESSAPTENRRVNTDAS